MIETYEFNAHSYSELEGITVPVTVKVHFNRQSRLYLIETDADYDGWEWSDIMDSVYDELPELTEYREAEFYNQLLK